MKSKKNRDVKKTSSGTDKTFATIAVCLILIVFGVAIYNQPDSSLDLQAIKSELLIKEHSPSRGPIAAKVTIVEFLDPECESCRLMHPVLAKIENEYKGQIRIVTRYLPLHPNSLWAAAALEEAREIGKFDEALALLFENQPDWGNHKNPRPELIADYLVKIGVDRSRTSEEYLVHKHKWKIELDETDARKIGIRKTPTFIVNGRLLRSIGYDHIKLAVEFALNAQNTH